MVVSSGSCQKRLLVDVTGGKFYWWIIQCHWSWLSVMVGDAGDSLGIYRW